MKLQVALTAAGYDLSTPDGSYGPQTSAAVRSFQADQGLSPTGEVDETLFNLALSEAAKAPACTPATIRAAVGQLPNGTHWDDSRSAPRCASGWAIAKAPEDDEGAIGLQPARGFLMRVRGDHWAIEVSNWIVDYSTPSFATGSALSPLRFSELFGGKGWPGHVSSAAEVVRYLMVEAPDQGINELNELAASVWLDSAGMDIWKDWQIYGDGSLVSCVSEPAANVYFSRGHWECIWQSEIATYVISINKVLTTATMAIRH